MKLINQSAEILHQAPGLDGVYKHVELAGRTAYHSLDKITPDSAKDFVDRMIKSNHGAALEHGTVYLYLEVNPSNAFSKCDYPSANFTSFYNWSDVVGYIAAKYRTNNYSKVVTTITKDHKAIYKVYITTNLRVIIENNWLDDLQYLCSPTEFHEKRYTMRLTCNRAIAQELTRHRVFSFLMESQRYINYSKERHGGEITFISPSWIDDNRQFKHSEAYDNCYERLYSAFEEAESAYFDLIDEGFTPQQARVVLPNATKTELIMTGFKSDWKHFFDLRYFETTGKVDPDMKDLSTQMIEELNENNIKL